MKRLHFPGLILLLALALPFAAFSADGASPPAPPAGTNAPPVGGAFSEQVQTAALVLACIVVLGILILIVAVGPILFKQWKKKLTADQSHVTTTVSDQFFRSRLAWLLTTGALIFIGVIATIVLFCAG